MVYGVSHVAVAGKDAPIILQGLQPNLQSQENVKQPCMRKLAITYVLTHAIGWWSDLVCGHDIRLDMCILPLLICSVASLPGWLTANGAAYKLDCAAEPQG